jgi:hypothetical protein
MGRGNALTLRVPMDHTPHRFPIHPPGGQPNSFFRHTELKPYRGKRKAVVPTGKYFGIAFRSAVRLLHLLGHLVKKLNSESE